MPRGRGGLARVAVENVRGQRTGGNAGYARQETVDILGGPVADGRQGKILELQRVRRSGTGTQTYRPRGKHRKRGERGPERTSQAGIAACGSDGSPPTQCITTQVEDNIRNTCK